MVALLKPDSLEFAAVLVYKGSIYYVQYGYKKWWTMCYIHVNKYGVFVLQKKNGGNNNNRMERMQSVVMEG